MPDENPPTNNYPKENLDEVVALQVLIEKLNQIIKVDNAPNISEEEWNRISALIFAARVENCDYQNIAALALCGEEKDKTAQEIKVRIQKKYYDLMVALDKFADETMSTDFADIVAKGEIRYSDEVVTKMAKTGKRQLIQKLESMTQLDPAKISTIDMAAVVALIDEKIKSLSPPDETEDLQSEIRKRVQELLQSPDTFEK